MTQTLLNHRLLSDGDALILCLHGIMGAGKNLTSLGRTLAQARPGYAVALVDLRNHGASPNPEPPHTLAACAGDIEGLADHLGKPIAGLVGHSFGGKVALQTAANLAASDKRLRELWVLDADPSRRPDGPANSDIYPILDALDTIAFPVATRETLVDALTEAHIPAGIAQWLATSLVRAEDGLRLRLEPPVIRTMLDDYFGQDLWPTPDTVAMIGALHWVIAEQSESFPEAARKDAVGLAKTHSNVHAHLVKNVGHWLHVEAPQALDALMRGESHPQVADMTP